eukprot:CAMPEP_0170504650 /NCGR_PEP_ID=MMETSP0208-20121228/48587_1 /TAXON_ID=197538 /ORGANISM="Strombidium inclinatum, Strain S3" /LENGTH=30 /DNA_ID= /DNA_START= /DNA_END= /DNA_ORIENTATION=
MAKGSSVEHSPKKSSASATMPQAALMKWIS